MRIETKKFVLDKIKENNGKLLEFYQENGKTKVKIQCKEGHVFEKSIQKLKNQWCPEPPCGKLNNWRSEKGFKLFEKKLFEISDGKIECTNEFPNLKGKFSFRCTKIECGYEWENPPSAQISNISSTGKPPKCAKCSGVLQTSLDDLNYISKTLNLKLISKNINEIKAKTELKWSCPKGHIITKSYYDLSRFYERNQGTNFTYCECNPQKKYRTTNTIIEEGILKGLQFQDPIFNGVDKPHKWKCLVCKRGIENSTWSSLKKSGCPNCNNDKYLNSIDKVVERLKKEEPTIVLIENQLWKGNTFRLRFKCNCCDEEFNKTPYQVLELKSLCPNCNNSRSRSEIIVHRYFEQLFGVKFIANTYQFEWLRNSNNEKMELDGYCPELNLGFEHHGKQHYEEMGIWNTDINKRKIDDELKVNLCIGRVKLIVIKDLFYQTKLEDLKDEIKRQAIKLKVKIPENFDTIEVNLDNINNIVNRDKFEKIKSYLNENKNWILVSNQAGYFVRVKCIHCSTIKTYNYLDLVSKKRKCTCNNKGINWTNKKQSYEFYKNLAEKYNCQLLSETFENQTTKLKFRCLKCASNPNLIHPYHSEFEIKPYTIKLKGMNSDMILSSKELHGKCGSFSFKGIPLNEIQKYIQREWEATGEILISEKDYIDNPFNVYIFRCSNPKHTPYEFPKKLRELSKAWCRKCGKIYSDRPKENYLKK